MEGKDWMPGGLARLTTDSQVQQSAGASIPRGSEGGFPTIRAIQWLRVVLKKMNTKMAQISLVVAGSAILVALVTVSLMNVIYRSYPSGHRTSRTKPLEHPLLVKDCEGDSLLLQDGRRLAMAGVTTVTCEKAWYASFSNSIPKIEYSTALIGFIEASTAQGVEIVWEKNGHALLRCEPAFIRDGLTEYVPQVLNELILYAGLARYNEQSTLGMESWRAARLRAAEQSARSRLIGMWSKSPGSIITVYKGRGIHESPDRVGAMIDSSLLEMEPQGVIHSRSASDAP